MGSGFSLCLSSCHPEEEEDRRRFLLNKAEKESRERLKLGSEPILPDFRAEHWTNEVDYPLLLTNVPANEKGSGITPLLDHSQECVEHKQATKSIVVNPPFVSNREGGIEDINPIESTQESSISRSMVVANHVEETLATESSTELFLKPTVPNSDDRETLGESVLPLVESVNEVEPTDVNPPVEVHETVENVDQPVKIGTTTETNREQASMTEPVTENGEQVNMTDSEVGISDLETERLRKIEEANRIEREWLKREEEEAIKQLEQVCTDFSSYWT
eukprot:TRINITY_DN2139_c0_g1_i2.p1 TRINITY_DN2139_c0_g1~~TRINITY_DN2139_c0_g1_i2.p1  ORF type:complete len:276 (-),score=57.59 TRINITY_DN2139_c0_g1_i2:784-1611(-)